MYNIVEHIGVLSGGILLVILFGTITSIISAIIHAGDPSNLGYKKVLIKTISMSIVGFVLGIGISKLIPHFGLFSLMCLITILLGLIYDKY